MIYNNEGNIQLILKIEFNGFYVSYLKLIKLLHYKNELENKYAHIIIFITYIQTKYNLYTTRGFNNRAIKSILDSNIYGSPSLSINN